MKRFLIRFFVVLVLAFAMPLTLCAQTLDEAARQAAQQNDAKVLSAHTVRDGDKQIHVIKLLTKSGVVKTVRIRVKKR